MDMVESVDADKLPQGFDYYALGHLHIRFTKIINGKFFVYPGPLFPACFSEFEELKSGSFCIVEYDGKINVDRRDVKLKEVISINIDANNKTAEQITDEIQNKISSINDSLITLRIEGTLSRGKTSDINFSKIGELSVNNKNILLRNTNKLESPEFKAEKEPEGRDIEEIEKNVLEKYGKKEGYEEFSDVIGSIIHSLDSEKQEGETNQIFESRLMEEINKIFEI